MDVLSDELNVVEWRCRVVKQEWMRQDFRRDHEAMRVFAELPRWRKTPRKRSYGLSCPCIVQPCLYLAIAVVPVVPGPMVRVLAAPDCLRALFEALLFLAMGVYIAPTTVEEEKRTIRYLFDYRLNPTVFNTRRN